jgi:hypothetical protein
VTLTWLAKLTCVDVSLAIRFVGQGNLPTAAKVVQLGWEFSLVIYPGSTPVGNATLVVANVLTCNKYSHKILASGSVKAPAAAGMHMPTLLNTQLFVQYLPSVCCCVPVPPYPGALEA